MTLLFALLLAVDLPPEIFPDEPHIWLDEVIPGERPPIGPMILIFEVQERGRWEV